MSIAFGAARLFRYVVSSAAKFSEVCVMMASESEFVFKAIDPSKTALLILTVPRESTLSYDVKEPAQLYVNLEDLGKVFRSAERDDSVTISWTQSSLSVSFERRGYSRSFTLPLSSVSEEIPEIEIEYPNTYVIPPAAFHEGVSGLEDVGDLLRVEGDEESLKLRAESELGEAEVIFSRERGGILEADVASPGFSVSFSMEFLSNFKPMSRVAEKLVLKAGPELPLYLETLSHGLTVRYYVAPRAE